MDNTTKTVLSAATIIAMTFGLLFSNVSAQIESISKPAVMQGIALPNSTAKITEVNLRPTGQEICNTVEGVETCCDEFDVKLLVNRYTDETYAYDLDQDTISVTYPSVGTCVNLDSLYQSLIQVEDERFNNADVVMK